MISCHILVENEISAKVLWLAIRIPAKEDHAAQGWAIGSYKKVAVRSRDNRR